MKIIHTSDLHLDSKIDSLPPEKARIRREEILSSFERLCEYASENGIKAVILSGDIFDTAKVSQKTVQRVFNAIGKADGTDFICISGNHDEQNVFYESDTVPENLKLISNEWEYYYYEDVCVAGISFDNTNVFSFYDSLSLDENRVNVVALHGQVVGYKSSGEAEVISLPKLKNKFIDYLALGHIHSNAEERFDLRGVFSYSGCLEGRGFDELGKKGFNLITVERGKLSSEFVGFSKRVIGCETFNIDVDKSIYENTDNILRELEKKYSKNDILKIELNGEIRRDYLFDKEYVDKKLSENFFFVKTVDKTETVTDERDYGSDKSIIGEFVRTCMSSGLDEETKQKVLLMGLNALNGREL